MPQFVRCIHDLMPLEEEPDVVVADLCFGVVPVKLYQPRAPSCTLRPGIVFHQGSGKVFGSLGKSPSHRPPACRVTASNQSWGDTQHEGAPLSSALGLKATVVTRELGNSRTASRSQIVRQRRYGMR